MKVWQRTLITFSLLAGTLLAAALHQPTTPQPTTHHFTKIDPAGNPLAAWAGPWSCVCDRRSGLLWEVKTDNENIHEGLWTYSWYRAGSEDFAAVATTDFQEQSAPAVGTPNQGDCYFEAERCDTADLVRRTRSEELCGATDWRLPSPQELHTLIDNDSKQGQPTIDTAFFPNTKRGDYWTSAQGESLQAVYKNLHAGALAISFVDGQRITLPHRNAAFVRLVATDSKSCH